MSLVSAQLIFVETINTAVYLGYTMNTVMKPGTHMFWPYVPHFKLKHMITKVKKEKQVAGQIWPTEVLKGFLSTVTVGIRYPHLKIDRLSTKVHISSFLKYLKLWQHLTSIPHGHYWLEVAAEYIYSSLLTPSPGSAPWGLSVCNDSIRAWEFSLPQVRG